MKRIFMLLSLYAFQLMVVLSDRIITMFNESGLKILVRNLLILILKLYENY